MGNIDYDYEETTAAVDAAKKAASKYAGDINSMLIYVFMGIVVALLITCVILLIVTIVKLSSINGRMTNTINASNAHGQMAATMSGVGCVFCPNCGNQYDASEKMCPHCKTKKMVY